MTSYEDIKARPRPRGPSIRRGFVVLLAVVLGLGASPIAQPAEAAVNCHAVIAASLARVGARLHLFVDAAHPKSRLVVDLGAGCRVAAELTMAPSGANDLLLTSSGTTGLQTPNPPAPPGTAGVDPYCHLKAWQWDSAALEMWVAELWHYWDNWDTSGTAAIVNPRGSENWSTDPFWTNTYNAISYTWLTYPSYIRATGTSDFHSDGGPTDDGVVNTIDATAGSCNGYASFWGPTVPGGGYLWQSYAPVH